MSELDLNFEHGKIEEPHRPTLRAVAPVFLDGSRRGLMVLNIAADGLLASLRVNLPAGSDLVMLNATGGWITGGGALDWQFMLDPSARLSAQDPALWTSIEGQYSGKEFLVVANTPSLTDAMGLAERIRASIASTPCPCSPDTLIAITTSVGVAQPHVGETIEQLLERADEALYRAKHAGRNRVMKAGAAIA